jgi:DNA-binding PadR family transcriptional regulator
MSLRYAILGLITHQELSGYEITRRFEESVGYFWHARSQQIYPELARLEQARLVTGRTVEQVGRPHKRVFNITEDGLAALRAWVATPSPLTFVKDEFMVKVWCYGELEAGRAMASLAEHRNRHEERLAAYRAIRAGFEGVDPRDLPAAAVGPYLTLEGGIAMEEAFLAWCRNAERVLALRMSARVAR